MPGICKCPFCVALQLVMKNVTVVFRNPAPVDTCGQLTQRSVFALRQVYTNTSVELFNATAGRLAGPVTINVDVRNGSTDAAGKLGVCSVG
jgi:hypothetical protein